MKPIICLSLIGLSLAGCAAPSPDVPAPLAGASEEVLLGVEDVEPADGVVPGEEEIEVASAPDAPKAAIMLTEMAGVPEITASHYDVKPVSDLGLKKQESPEAVGRLLRKRFGIGGAKAGTYDEELEIFEDGADAVVVFTAEGYADDSVKAAQHVVQIFFPAAVPAGVTGYGVRYKCYRAEDTDAWQNTVCR
jgi:hypothetical protein